VHPLGGDIRKLPVHGRVKSFVEATAIRPRQCRASKSQDGKPVNISKSNFEYAAYGIDTQSQPSTWTPSETELK
jgi:hypothetical protein